MEHVGETRTRFRTTSWTLIEALRDDSHPQRERALELLSQRYWPAIYASYRRMGRSRDDASELTQGFFADVVLEKKLFETADAERGRLRSLLLIALKRYAISAHRKRQARPDQWGPSLDNLGREETFLRRDEADDAEAAFDRRWAMALFEEALARTESSLRSEGLGQHWQAFEQRVVQPAIRAVDRPNLATVAERTGFPSATHVASALKVVRKRLDLMLREVAGETAATPGDQEAEYQSVRAALS